MAELTSTEPYRPNGWLAQLVVVALGANAAVCLMGALFSFYKLSSDEALLSGLEEELTAYDLFEAALGLLYLVIWIATIVLFCVWLYRAYKNLAALGIPKPALKYSPGWAVGSFFVPFVNLVIPYRAVRETWAKSEPSVTPGDFFFAASEHSAPSFMAVWWGFWLVSNFVNNAAFRVGLRAETPDALRTATWLDLAGDLLTVVAAFFAIAVVRDIERRQQERSRHVNYTPDTPPPPPIFNPPAQA